MKSSVGILGLGYLGREVADWQEWPEGSWGSCRETAEVSEAASNGLTRIHFDWESEETWHNIPSGEAKLVLTIPPLAEEPESERTRLEIWGAWMKNHRALLTDLVYISSTGVYPNRAGNWDESSPLTPDTQKGRTRYVSETVLDRFFNLRVIRAGAIYGPGRHIGERIRNRKPIPQGDHPVHRIHVSDLAQIVRLAVTETEFPQILNAVDREAAPAERVAEWMARQPQFSSCTAGGIVYGKGGVTRKNLSRNRNRKISNARLTAIPKFVYRFPSYREGLRQAILADLPQP